MDKFSEFIPIIIGLIIFIAKLVSESNKKKEQSTKKRPVAIRKETSYSQPYTYKTPDYSEGYDSSYPTLDYSNSPEPQSILQPEAIPDVDYDKVNADELRKKSEFILHKPLERFVKQENKKLVSIRNKMKDKNNIQEIIILSEILNKPKALRRW